MKTRSGTTKNKSSSNIRKTKNIILSLILLYFLAPTGTVFDSFPKGMDIEAPVNSSDPIPDITALSKQEKPVKPQIKIKKALESSKEEFVQEIQSDGEILLTEPQWEKGQQFFFTIKTSQYNPRSNKWLDSRTNGRKYLIHILDKAWDDVYMVLEAVTSTEWKYKLCNSKLRRGEMIEKTPYTCFLMLPKFPVREGMEVYILPEFGPVKQNAYRDGEKIVIELILKPHMTLHQTWSQGGLLWEKSELNNNGPVLDSSWTSCYYTSPSSGYLPKDHNKRIAIRTKEERISEQDISIILERALHCFSYSESDERERDAWQSMAEELLSPEQFAHVEPGFSDPLYFYFPGRQ